jgi:hypothetical protein
LTPPIHRIIIAALAPDEGNVSAQTTHSSEESRNKATVEQSFKASQDGTGSPFDLFAEDAT